MTPLTRRLSALILALSLAVGNMVVCAGWQPRPEARMACCAKGVCPMRKAVSRDTGSSHVVTQGEADTCCAASERDDATPSSQASVPAQAIVLLPVTFPALDVVPAWRPPARQSSPPPALDSVPRHVLLAVFLI